MKTKRKGDEIEPIVTEILEFDSWDAKIPEWVFKDCECIVKRDGVWRLKRSPVIAPTDKGGKMVQIEYAHNPEGWPRDFYKYIE